MRLKIKLSINNNSISVNNQHIVNSYIHSCLGVNNKYHDSKSDYCITDIRGGKLNSDKNTLVFSNNMGYIIVSSNNQEFINDLLKGVTSNLLIGDGISLNGIEFLNEQIYDGYNIFRTLTPILLKEKVNDKTRFITLKDSDFSSKLEERLKNKLLKIDNSLDLSNFKIKINEHPNNKTKVIKVKNVYNYASLCDVIVFSDKKTAEMIYNLGLGQSTGCGFGTIYNSKNHYLYHDKH